MSDAAEKSVVAAEARGAQRRGAGAAGQQVPVAQKVSQPEQQPGKQRRIPRHEQFRQHAIADRGKPGEPKWVLRSVLRFLCNVIIVPLFRVRLSGAENMPAGQVLLSPNHLSYVDAMLVMAHTTQFNKPMRFLAKRELYNIKIMGWVIDQLGALPVARGKAELETMRMASNVIKAGDSMAVFPEGTRVRSEDMIADQERALGEAFGGAAWLAIRNNIPVVPVGIAGAEDIRPDGMLLFRLPRINVHYGAPLVPDEVVPPSEYKRKERVEKLTELMMEGLAQARAVAVQEKALRDGDSKSVPTEGSAGIGGDVGGGVGSTQAGSTQAAADSPAASSPTEGRK